MLSEALQVFSSSVRVKARALKKEKRKAEALITQERTGGFKT